MKRFYCFGKKDFCDDINKCEKCEHENGDGGEEREVDAPDVVEVVRCEKCKHLEVINDGKIYARCKETDFEFMPFGTDTRKHYCSFGEREGTK